jgi:hypothetical protein
MHSCATRGIHGGSCRPGVSHTLLPKVRDVVASFIVGREADHVAMRAVAGREYAGLASCK